MIFLIGILTVALVITCLLLILLVLIQLPKKEAGAGLAFGGAATDALFGAGGGNVLTKVTKYATIAFFVLAMGLSLLQMRFYHGSDAAFKEKVGQAGLPSPAAQPQPEPQNAVVTPVASNPVPQLLTIPPVSNAPAAETPK